MKQSDKIYKIQPIKFNIPFEQDEKNGKRTSIASISDGRAKYGIPSIRKKNKESRDQFLSIILARSHPSYSSGIGRRAKLIISQDFLSVQALQICQSPPVESSESFRDEWTFHKRLNFCWGDQTLYPLSWCARARGKHLFTCPSSLALIVSVGERDFPKRFNLRRHDRMFPGLPVRGVLPSLVLMCTLKR